MPAAPPTAPALRQASSLLATVGVLLTGALALLQTPPPVPAASGAPGQKLAEACPPGAGGFFRGRFFGALDLTADWSAPAMTCDGMRRPDGSGARLYFAGAGPASGRVAVVIGLESRDALSGGAELPANVTVIDETDGRFFSSAGPGRCWARIGQVTPVSHRPGHPAGSRIEGLVYCLGALPSVGDRSSLTLGDLQFSGWLAADGE